MNTENKRKLHKDLTDEEIADAKQFGNIIPYVYSIDWEEVIHQFLELDGKPYGEQSDEGCEPMPEMDWPNSMLDKYEYADIAEILNDPDWYIGDGKFGEKVVAVVRKIVAMRLIE